MQPITPPSAPAKKRIGLIAGILTAIAACLCLLAGLTAGVVLLFKSDALSFAKWQQYTNAEKGFRLSYPEDWVYEESEDSVTFASSQEILDQGPESGGAGLVVLYLPSSLLPSSPAELIYYFAGSGEWGNTEIIGQVSESKVSGYPAASAELSSFDQMEGLAYHMTITAILTPDTYYVMVGVSKEDTWSAYQAILQRIVNSLEILTP